MKLKLAIISTLLLISHAAFSNPPMYTVELAPQSDEPAISFSIDAFETALLTHVPSDRQVAVSEEYYRIIERAEARGDYENFGHWLVYVPDLLHICEIAGWDVSSTLGHKRCLDFLLEINKHSRGTKYYADMGKIDNMERCRELGGIWTADRFSIGTIEDEAGNIKLDKGTKRFTCVDTAGYEISYYSPCEDLTHPGNCITFFKNLRTQVPKGHEFINEYKRNDAFISYVSKYLSEEQLKEVQEKGRDKALTLTCWKEKSEQNLVGDDYIHCSAFGESFQFQFNTLNAEVGKASGISEAKYICYTYGYEAKDYNPRGNSNYNERTYCEGAKEAICNDIIAFAKRVGHDAEFYDGKCLIKETPNITYKQILRTYGGIDNYMFRILNTRTEYIVDWLPKFLSAKFLTNFTNTAGMLDENFESTRNIYCDPAPSVISSGPDDDDVITCYVDGHPIDFVFDDLSETWGSTVQNSELQKQCITMDGVAADEYCDGITKSQCEQINEMFPDSVSWHPDWSACVFTDQRQFNFAVNGMFFALSLAGGIFFIVTDAILTSAFYLLEDWEMKYPGEKVADFASEAKDCNNAECAMRIIGTYLKDIEEIVDVLNEDELAKFENAWMDLQGHLTQEQLESAILNSAESNETLYMDIAGFSLLAFSFVNPKGAAKAVGKAGKLGKIWNSFSNLFGNTKEVKQIVDAQKDIKNITLRFFPYKNPSVEPRTSPTIGYYTRIYIDNPERDKGIAQQLALNLQNHGYLVSANVTVDGRHFIAVSKENIFNGWSGNNWLLSSGRSKNMSKSEKITEAMKNDNLGYHGSDADISIDDMIRPSRNTSSKLGGVGYGIAKEKNAAEIYAIRRLIERQNTGVNIDFYVENGRLIVDTKGKTINISNKTGYVYTTAKRSDIRWQPLKNQTGSFNAAQMPEPVEILAKESINLDDLIRKGRVEIRGPRTGNIEDIIPRDYNNISDAELKQKLDYLYKNSASRADATRALARVWGLDKSKADIMINDLTEEINKRLRNNPMLINQAMNWKNLSMDERKLVVLNFHETVTTTRRKHAGNTVIGLEIEGTTRGLFRPATANLPKEFHYNMETLSKGSFVDAFNTIIHENAHAFQVENKTTIPKPFVEWATRNYVKAKEDIDLYFENIMEQEARHVGEHVAKNVASYWGF